MHVSACPHKPDRAATGQGKVTVGRRLAVRVVGPMLLIALQHRGTSGGSAAEDAAPPGPAMERGRSKTTPSPAGPARDSDLSERCLPDRTETHARSARRDAAAARKTPAGRAMVFSTRSDVKGSPAFLSLSFFSLLAGHCRTGASAAAARGHRRSTGGGNLSAVTAARGQRESPLALQIATALLCLPDLRRRAALW